MRANVCAYMKEVREKKDTENKTPGQTTERKDHSTFLKGGEGVGIAYWKAVLNIIKCNPAPCFMCHYNAICRSLR